MELRIQKCAFHSLTHTPIQTQHTHTHTHTHHPSPMNTHPCKDDEYSIPFLCIHTRSYTYSQNLMRAHTHTHTHTLSFSPRKDAKGSLYFYSISIPIKWNQRNRQACYLIKWDCGTWKQLARQKTGKELLSAMAVR